MRRPVRSAKLKLAGAAIGVVAAISLSACGSSSTKTNSGNNSPSNTSPTTATQTTKAPSGGGVSY
jgi:hypothetical protein